MGHTTIVEQDVLIIDEKITSAVAECLYRRCFPTSRKPSLSEGAGFRAIGFLSLNPTIGTLTL